MKITFDRFSLVPDRVHTGHLIGRIHAGGQGATYSAYRLDYALERVLHLPA